MPSENDTFTRGHLRVLPSYILLVAVRRIRRRARKARPQPFGGEELSRIVKKKKQQ